MPAIVVPPKPNNNPSEWLRSLGSTPEVIAARLEALGVRGKRGSSYRCPIVVGLYKFSKPWPGLQVHRYHLVYNDLQVLDPETPEAIRDFMRRFDAGEFPQVALP